MVFPSPQWKVWLLTVQCFQRHRILVRCCPGSVIRNAHRRELFTRTEPSA